MSLRKLVRSINFMLMFGLFAWYSGRYFREVGEDVLVRTWTITFYKLDASCIYWVTLRVAGWIFVYLCLLRLEGGFSVYLYIRHRSFAAVFRRIFAQCIGIVLAYYGIGTLAMAVCHKVMVSETEILKLLCQGRLPFVLIGECLGGLSFCLAAYLVYLVIRRAEAGFLAVLSGRIILGVLAGWERPGLPIQMAFTAAMTVAVFYVAFYRFRQGL